MARGDDRGEKEAIEEPRELAQDDELFHAVLNRLELDELLKDERFQESFEQMRRGERGAWPERWAGKLDG